ncbi:MAG: hypothetical protein M1834_001549 [Cirrosporium novae-zelandiae]|nr:MAG: hypothetical protein M1834_004066 [Cirrosporium novae-zelandiae]KAI9735534.1 MAG: hypothetical protein M1834_001549 [Cirrosporium novae-zelandiae]
MAKNLRAKIPESDSLIIYDTNVNTTDKFVKEAGVTTSNHGVSFKGTRIEIASGCREVAERSDTIITVLPEPSHVKSVFHNILSGELPEKSSTTTERLFIDCSTIDPLSSKEVANAVHTHHSGRFVDAPMSGGVVGAQAGTLTFMLGASSKTGSLIERAKEALSLMGKRVIHMGEQSSGLSAKLANNYLLAISNIATAEAMNLGVRWGLEPKALADLINSSSGKCWSSEVNNPVPGILDNAPASDDYNGGFGVSLMKKDLILAMAAAEKAGAKLELAETARRVYEMVEQEYKGKDFSVVYQYLGRHE